MTSEPTISPAEEHPVNTTIPAEPELKQEKARDPRELLAKLRVRFEVFRTFQPLAIGIDKAIRAHFPEADRKALRIALSMHTHCNRYLRLLAKAEQRFDLDGQAVAEVTEEHRQFATTALKERLQRRASEQAKSTDNPDQDAKFSQSSKQTTNKRIHSRINNAHTVNKVATVAGQSAEKPEEKKVSEKPRYTKHPNKKHEKIIPASRVSDDPKAQSPVVSATLAEKLALLTEKFGRK